MSMVLLALLIALAVTVISLAADAFKHPFAGVSTFVFSFLASWLLLWTSTPVFSGAGWFWLLTLNCIVAAVCFGAAYLSSNEFSFAPVLAVFVIVLTLLWGAVLDIAPIGQGGADKLAGQLDVTMAKPGDYPETDADHMKIVGKASAERKANQALSNNKDINTYYDLGDGSLQSVNDHLYYIYELELTNRRNQKRLNYTVPGFVVVDAENPDADSRLRLEDENGQPYKLRYVTSMPWEYSVDRLVYNNGYRRHFVDDRSFEVTDQWQPFYTASINKPALRWKRAVPVGFITIDPSNGKIEQYKLDAVPTWIDRVYSRDVVKDMLDWWGRWGSADYDYLFESKGSRFKPSGNPELVYTKGGHPSWQVLMTSRNSDTAVNYIALVEARTNKATMYSVPDGMTVEDTVRDALTSSKDNISPKRTTAGLTLHKIYGQLTWVAPLEPNTDDDNKKSFAGVGLVEATNVNASRAIMGTTKSEALDKYRTQLATSSNNNSPEEDADDKSLTGKVAKVTQVVTGGQTFVYFLLEGDNAHVYKGQLTDNQPELPFISVGATVTISFLDTGVGTRRDIRSYDDADLALTQ